MGLEREDEAVAVYRQALATLPAKDIQGRNIILNQLGNALKNLGRFTEAEAAYAEQVALMPDDADGWSNRARNEGAWAIREARAGHLAEARAHTDDGLVYIARAQALNPTNPTYSEVAGTLRELRDQL